MKVLLLTDSLSLPRKFKDGVVKWEEVYPNMLKKSLPAIEFIHIGIGGATITELLRLQNYYALIFPDIVVLQCGIVDCTPRALSQLEQQIIKKLHLVRLFNPFISFLRKYRNLTYTNLRRYEKALIDLKSKFPGTPFIALGILPPNNDYEKLAPGISKKILRYNIILSKHTVYIDNSDFPREGILSDHHHLSVRGHTLIHDRLKEVLTGLLK